MNDQPVQTRLSISLGPAWGETHAAGLVQDSDLRWFECLRLWRDARAGLHLLDLAGLLARATGTSRSRCHHGHGLLGFSLRDGGARLFYCIEYWGTEIQSLWEVLQYWKGGIVYYGGLIGGSVAFFVYRRMRPFPLRPYMDVLAPSIAIGTMFGRLGCFLNGCCYGRVCDLPWAVSFPKPSPAWLHHHEWRMISEGAVRSLAVHPTQIYSAIDGLVLLLLLSAFFPLRRRDGEVFALLIVTYPITRFLIEFLRNDEGAFFAGLTISQIISVALFLTGLAFWGWLFRQPAELYSDQHARNEPRQELLATARS